MECRNKFPEIILMDVKTVSNLMIIYSPLIYFMMVRLLESH